jgi:Leucine-rich repeat (LRR) protein
MKIIKLLLEFFGLILLLSLVFLTTILMDQPIEIPDPAFEQGIREALHYYGKPIYKSQALSFLELDLSNRDIESIAGIEHFRNLEVLNLRGNKLANISPLGSLTKLRSLDLANNRIVDLEMANFDQVGRLPLIRLNLDQNAIFIDDLVVKQLSNIEGLAGFRTLQEISAVGNQITDISPIGDLPNLTTINFSDNQISNLDGLQNLDKIEYVNLRQNQLVDISALQGSESLKYLNLHSNPNIKEISSIKSLTNLNTLILRNVPVGDQISVLEKLTQLSRLNLRNCKIQDIAVLAKIMREGGLQDHPESETYAYLDIMENPLTNDPYQLRALSPYWENIHTKYPVEINFSVLNPPIFSKESGFYSKGFDLSLGTELKNVEIFYTLDGSEPSREATKYSSPIWIERQADRTAATPRAVIVRAKVMANDGYDTSPTISQSYFIGDPHEFTTNLPIVSLITDPAYLFDPELGIASEKNFREAGKKWERPIHMEFFDPHGDSLYSADALFRLHGQASRNLPQKSLRLYGNNNYEALQTLDYEFFPNLRSENTGELITQFPTLILRNSGNDWRWTMLRDGLIQKLVEHTLLDVQAYRPVNVFLNGEYWGILNMRERLDAYYLENHYGILPEDVALYEVEAHDNFYSQDPQSNDFLTMLDLLRNVNHPDQEAYSILENNIDISNFIDNQIIYLYAANGDWKGNNVRFWKKITNGTNPAAMYGHDGRWRWMVVDMDFGFRDASVNMMPITTYESDKTQLVSTLMKYPEFRIRFINRYADLLNTAFLPERVINEIDQFEADLEGDIGRHIERWNTLGGSMEKWRENIDVLREFALLRPDYVREHICQQFDLVGTYQIQLDVLPDQGYLNLNSIDIVRATPGVENPSAWQGVYFRGLPITLTAIPKAGYQFSHWEGDLGNVDASQATIIISPRADISITAIFTEISEN